MKKLILSCLCLSISSHALAQDQAKIDYMNQSFQEFSNFERNENLVSGIGLGALGVLGIVSSSYIKDSPNDKLALWGGIGLVGISSYFFFKTNNSKEFHETFKNLKDENKSEREKKITLGEIHLQEEAKKAKITRLITGYAGIALGVSSITYNYVGTQNSPESLKNFWLYQGALFSGFGIYAILSKSLHERKQERYEILKDTEWHKNLDLDASLIEGGAYLSFNYKF